MLPPENTFLSYRVKPCSAFIVMFSILPAKLFCPKVMERAVRVSAVTGVKAKAFAPKTRSCSAEPIFRL